MARSVADCALLDAVVCGEDPSLPVLSPRGLRLGVPSEFWAGLHTGLEHQLGAALGALRAAGVELIPISLNIDLSAVSELGLTIAMAENLPALRTYFAEHDLPFDAGHLAAAIASADVRAVFHRLNAGTGPDATAYHAALAEVHDRLQPAWTLAFAHHAVDPCLRR
jgi:mandelamide amidase